VSQILSQNQGNGEIHARESVGVKPLEKTQRPVLTKSTQNPSSALKETLT
jgi:hypothetical protein